MVWKQDELSPWATPARSRTAFENWEGCGEVRNRWFQGTSEDGEHRAPLISGTAAILPNVLSQPRFWRSAYWINDVYWRLTACWALPVNLKMKAAGFSLRDRKVRLRGWEEWTLPRIPARQWCCRDLNPGLSESHVRIHFPSLIESWVQILILSPNKEQNVERTERERESSTHDYRVGKEDVRCPLYYRNPKTPHFLFQNWPLRCWQGIIENVRRQGEG